MNLFGELVDYITNFINGTVQADTNDALVTALCLNSRVSTTELNQLIERNIPADQITPQIREWINNVIARNKIVKTFKMFNPKFNRIYGETFLDDDKEPEIDQFERTYFTEPLIYSGYPYYCPNGWRRYSLLIDNFELYRGWPVAYHGTASKNVLSILDEGLRPSEKKNGYHCAVFGDGYYFSPSIEYCGHHRYAETVLQCRVKPKSFKIRSETLLKDESKVIDPNFNNSELEWLIPKDYVEKCRENSENFIVIYGIMTRLTEQEPKNLSVNQWWQF
ncbi:neuralized 4 [Brachionus plicatilis]|uniref:Neuralized 4 n=1 Tax=Brachionus plicatilis TaxID=10195 RepID=A0A3M7RZ86_BRAPC|nr:neuralized 4 [Brachionus plicatilis]